MLCLSEFLYIATVGSQSCAFIAVAVGLLQSIELYSLHDCFASSCLCSLRIRISEVIVHEDRTCNLKKIFIALGEAFLHSTEALNANVLNFGQYGMAAHKSTLENKQATRLPTVEP